jgi:hypothetical protein
MRSGERIESRLEINELGRKAREIESMICGLVVL